MSKTQESFDAVVLNDEGGVILFQHTIAPRPVVKSHGVGDLLKSIQRPLRPHPLCLSFTKTLAEAYSYAQNISTPNDLKWRGEIKQYRLIYIDDGFEAGEVVAEGGVSGESSGAQRAQRMTSHGKGSSAGTGGSDSAGKGRASGGSDLKKSVRFPILFTICLFI